LQPSGRITVNERKGLDIYNKVSAELEIIKIYRGPRIPIEFYGRILLLIYITYFIDIYHISPTQHPAPNSKY
jgi:hypothetical protein